MGGCVMSRLRCAAAGVVVVLWNPLWQFSLRLPTYWVRINMPSHWAVSLCGVVDMGPSGATVTLLPASSRQRG